jgi:hypothetical protein
VNLFRPAAAAGRGLHPTWALASILLLSTSLCIARILADPPARGLNQTERWWPVVTSLVDGRGYVQCIPEYFPFGGPSNQVTGMVEPVPVLIFAAVARFTGKSLWAAAVAEVLFNLAILLLVYLLARELASAGTALVAALLWGLYLPAVQLVPQVSGELPAALGTTAGLLFFVRGCKSDHARDWLLAAVFVGLGALSRSAMLIVAAVLASGLAFERAWPVRRSARAVVRSLRPATLFALGVLATIAPWTVRNALVFGRPVLGSTLTGYNLYRQSQALETPDYLRFVGTDEGAQAVRDLVARRTDLSGRENEAQMDAVYRQEALREIAAHRLRYGVLTGYHFLQLWFNWLIPEAGGRATKPVDYLMMVQQGLLLIAAAIGARSKGRNAWPLVASLVLVCFAYMAVNSQMRYVVPVMPFTIVLAASGCVALYRRAVPSTSASAALTTTNHS